MTRISWNQLKQAIAGNNLNYTWIQDDNSYTVFTFNSPNGLETVIPITSPSSSDQLDFETNYKNSKVQQLKSPVISETSAYARLGLMFAVSTGAVSSGNSTETPYFYLNNSSSSSVSVRISKIRLSSPSSGNTLYKFYRNPTITSDGTTLNIVGARQNNQNNPQSMCYLLPTASNKGTIFKAINIPSGNSIELDLDYSVWIEPGNSLLITSTQSLLAGLSGIDVNFIEE